MSQQTDVSTGDLPQQQAEARTGWRFIQPAPGPERPDQLDRTGRQKGMAIMIGAGVAFWGGVGAIAWYLLNR